MNLIKEVFAFFSPKKEKEVFPESFFSHIGKPARDILYSEYEYESDYHSNNYLFSLTALTNLTFFGNTVITNSIKNRAFGFNARHDFHGNLHDFPGKIQASIACMSDKAPVVELAIVHRHGALCASTGLTANPTVTFSGTVGGRGFVLGFDRSLDKAAGVFTRDDYGVSFTHSNVTVALIRRVMEHALIASYHHTLLSPDFTGSLWSARITRVATELSHRFNSAETSFSFGVRHQIGDMTCVGAHVRSSGKVMALLQHCFKYLPSRALVTISGEFNFRCIDNRSAAKIGLAIAIR